VNPTISTDALGAYMRDLFAPEMTAQRELHDRVAKAHLEDFQDELTKETGTTVSFAMANLPLQSPADGAARPATTRSSGAQKAVRPRTPTRPHNVVDPAAPPAMPTAAIPTTELALADGTGAVEPSALDSSIAPPAKRSRTALVLAILAAAAVLAVVVVYLAQGKKQGGAQVAETKQPAPPQIRVESIPPDEQTPSVVPIVDAAVPEVEQPPIEPKKDPHKKRHGDKKEPKVEPKAELTKDAVIAKYRAARAAYETYKAANGGRFDQEWNDLASYVQYHPSELEELARRIESFRAKMRE
jgi:hypothetical protein